MSTGCRRLALWTLQLAMLGGCRWVDGTPAPTEILGQARRVRGLVEFEIIFVKLPPQHDAISDQLWQQIDELVLAADLRARLHENGFRVGLLSGQMPPDLTRLLELTNHSNHLEQSLDSHTLAAEPTATLRLLQTRSGRRAEVIASQVYDRLPLLTRVDGQLQGKSFEKAEGRFGLKAEVRDDQRLLVELSPELHYGDAQLKFVGGDGVLRTEPARPKRTFDDLKISATLSPGQMLVLSSLSECPGSLGHYFLIAAHRLAPAAALASFVYSEIVWAIALGYLVFGNWPHRWTLVGCAIIVASGLYMLHRERKLRGDM